jgi:hypothetical protein
MPREENSNQLAGFKKNPNVLFIFINVYQRKRTLLTGQTE